MTARPLVSIVIPTYNQEAYLAQTVSSALAQDYEPLEVIVADDCSTDRTGEAAASFADPRLKYVRNERNLGRVGNYRAALYTHASGEWALNLDGDDILIDRTFISAAVAAARDEEGTVLVFADRYERDDPFAVPAPLIAAKTAAAEYFEGTSYVLSLPGNRTRIHHLAALYDRAAAMAIDFYRADIVSSDYESLWRLALGKKIAHLPVPVAIWRRHRENASRTGSMASTLRNLSLFASVRDYAASALGEEARPLFDRWVTDNVANRYYGSACNQLRTGDFASLAELRAFVKTEYPAAYRKAMLDPKTYFRGLLSLLRYGASRLRG